MTETRSTTWQDMYADCPPMKTVYRLSIESMRQSISETVALAKALPEHAEDLLELASLEIEEMHRVAAGGFIGPMDDAQINVELTGAKNDRPVK